MKKIKIPFIAERVEKLRAILTALNEEIDGFYNSPLYLRAPDLNTRDAVERAAGLADRLAERRELVTRLNLLTGSDCIFEDDAEQIKKFFVYRNALALSYMRDTEPAREVYRDYKIEHEEAAAVLARLAEG